MQELLPILAAIGINVLAVGVVVIAVLFYRQIRGDERYHLVVELVQAAEQMFKDPNEGPARKEWVLAQVQARLPQLDADLVATLIEAAVYRLNAEQNERGVL